MRFSEGIAQGFFIVKTNVSEAYTSYEVTVIVKVYGFDTWPDKSMLVE